MSEYKHTENTNYKPNSLDRVLDFTDKYLPSLGPFARAVAFSTLLATGADALAETKPVEPIPTDGKTPAAKVVDSDGDGISDKVEIKRYHTKPDKADSDGDGVNDNVELYKDKTDPMDPKDYKGAKSAPEGDGMPDDASIDREVDAAIKDMKNPPKSGENADWFNAVMVGGGTYADIRANIAQSGKHSLIGYAGTQFGLGYDFDNMFGINAVGNGSQVNVDLGWHPNEDNWLLLRAGYIANLEDEINRGPTLEQFPSLIWAEAGGRYQIDDNWSIIGALNVGSLTGTDADEVNIGGMGMLGYDNGAHGFRLGAAHVGGELSAGIFYIWGAQNNLPTHLIYSVPSSINVDNPGWVAPGNDGIPGTSDDDFSGDGGDGYKPPIVETRPTIPGETNPGPTVPPTTPPETTPVPDPEPGPSIPPVQTNAMMQIYIPTEIIEHSPMLAAPEVAEPVMPAESGPSIPLTRYRKSGIYIAMNDVLGNEALLENVVQDVGFTKMGAQRIWKKEDGIFVPGNKMRSYIAIPSKEKFVGMLG